MYSACRESFVERLVLSFFVERSIFKTTKRSDSTIRQSSIVIRHFINCLTTIIILCLSSAAISRAADCDEFVTLVKPAKDAYMQKHRIYPIPADIKALAKRFMPRLWVHPDSWQPIAFEDYLDQARVVRNSDKQVILQQPEWRDLADLSDENQCGAHLDAPEITSRNPAPLYIQVLWDESPANPAEKWTYIKYNLVFDWSGLAAEVGWLGRVGAFLSGGRIDRWHRLDIHLAAILAFDPTHKLRLLTLAQHNHQQTFLPGRDFPAGAAPHLVAAVRSNELYLDDGRKVPAYHRVVPFFNDVAFLVDASRKPRLWARDVAYGRNAGGREVQLRPVFIEPGHPLANFAGLLAPPRRLLGIYIGRDGPPGYNYYALPSYIPLVNFAAMGYWRAGDQDLLQQLEPMINGGDPMHGTDWPKVVALMRKRLANAMALNPTINFKYSDLIVSASPAEREASGRPLEGGKITGATM